MREILFRGKEAYKDRWVNGVPVKATSVDESEILIIESVFECDEYACRGCDFTPVIPETVGQYTGLTDKNGTKIFEGDILKGYVYPFFNEEKDEFNYFAEVVWFENSPAFGCVTHKNPLSKVNGISSGNTDYLEDFYSNCWEVIGNIHDNPELLGGETK